MEITPATSLDDLLAYAESLHPDLSNLIEEIRSELLAATPETPDARWLDVSNGIAAIADEVQALLASGTTRPRIHVAGGSASGKTTRVAGALVGRLGGAMLSFDHYYLGKQELAEGVTWDDPEALDLALFAAHLQELREGQAIQMPQYSFQISERTGYAPFSVAEQPLVVEGLFALHPQIVAHADLTVFVDASAKERLRRRLARDAGAERANGDLKGVLEYYWRVVHPKYNQHILPTRDAARFIIQN